MQYVNPQHGTFKSQLQFLFLDLVPSSYLATLI